MSFPDALAIDPLHKPPRATIAVPGSKSITNRALVLAALAAKGYGYAVRGAPRCEDTEVMIECLRALGFRVLTDWPDDLVCVSSEEQEAAIPVKTADLFVSNSGTTMRFLTALAALGQGRYRLDGTARMRERPIEDLLLALRQLGVKAYSERGNGCPPVVVEANGLGGGNVRIKGHISSQFISALMMAATCADGIVSIQVEGPLVSEPYVRITARMIQEFGFALHEAAPDHFEIRGCGTGDSDVKKAAPFPEPYTPPHHRPLREYQIEPDATAAGYFWGAAAILGGEVTIAHLHEKSLQGDVRFLKVLEDMGCQASFGPAGATLRGGPLYGVDVDMNDISDTVMTLGTVACFAEGPTTIRNVAHIRHKETDRLSALATELRRIGAGVDERADGLTITPAQLHGAQIETYNDHRMAMSLALAGLKVRGIIIKNAGCVAKTYPGFFEDLERLRQ